MLLYTSKELPFAAFNLAGMTCRFAGTCRPLTFTPQSGIRWSTSQEIGVTMLLRTAKRVMRPEEWGGIASYVIHEMGTPLGSARGQARELGFSIQTAATNLNKMAPSARKLTPAQERFFAVWRGPVVVVTSVDDVHALCGARVAA